MKCWLDTFLTEKQVDPETVFVLDVAGVTHYVPFEVIRDFVEHLPESLQKQIKEKLIQIDFLNGDVLHFFRHLALGMVTLT
jgi:hypothetical protein